MTDRAALGAPAWAFRVALAGLGGVQFANGAWALLAPRSFYTEFPFGRGWVEALPAYNEHLMRDVGALFLATGFVLLAAAWSMSRLLVAVALVSYLLFSLPHAIFHLNHLEPYATGDAIANVVVLALTVIVPAALLAALALGARSAGRSPAVDGRPDGGGIRIATVPEQTKRPLVRLAYAFSRRRFGTVIDPLRLYAHNPRVMLGYGLHELAAERSSRVSERLKHLAVMRAAALCGCEWCLDFGSHLSAASGVTEADLRALPAYSTSERFTELERLVIDYAGGMSRTPVAVPADLVARLREHLDEPQLVELTDAIALENHRARFNWALGLGSQEFSEGAFCLRPEASQPEGAPRQP